MESNTVGSSFFQIDAYEVDEKSSVSEQPELECEKFNEFVFVLLVVLLAPSEENETSDLF